jgi:hypothetical protein
METEQPTLTKQEKKRLYMREYMRNWKTKTYLENPEKIRRANRSSYLAKTAGADIHEREKYGAFLHTVVTARKLLDELRRERPDFVADVILGAGVEGVWVNLGENVV